MEDRRLILKIASLLEGAAVESARFDARQIVAATRTEAQALNLAARRMAGEPLQYILGEWEFYGLPFYVGEGVLIPRADTELLVDAALSFIGDREISVADLCSGSGAVAVAIAKNSRARVSAIEKSEQAFGYLEKNVELNAVAVKCIKADIFCEHNEKYDLIVSNPPYIASAVIETLSQEVKREPKMALDGGEDGLDFYKRLTVYWKTRINSGGALAVEIGYDQAQAVTELFEQNGFENIKVLDDYTGNNRVIIGTVPVPTP